MWIWAPLVAIVTATVVSCATYFAFDALAAKDAADRIQASIAPAKQAAKDRDPEEISRILANVSDASVDFDKHTHGRLWDMAAKLPWLSAQVKPLQAASEAMGALNTAVLDPLEQQDLSIIEAVPIHDGRIDPQVAEPFAPIMRDAQSVIEEQTVLLNAVDLEGTDPRVASGVIKLRDSLADMLPAVETANEILPVVPQLLGAGTERTYLVMVQNNAEIRATGGIGGALIEIHVKDGLIEMGNYVSLADLTRAEVLPETDEELALFGGSLVTTGQDINYTPEFPRIAELLTAFWARDIGATPSAVVTMDPVTLEYLVGDIKPVTIDGLTFDGSNVADTLLKDSYLAIPDPTMQNAFFGRAASALFSEIMGGNIDIKGTQKAIAERRIMAWSPDPAETNVFETMHMDGRFLEDGDTLGLFVNDRTGAKLGYYVDAKAKLAFEQCQGQTPTVLTASYDLTLNFDGDMSTVPNYVAGGFQYSDAPRGSFAAYVFMYAPLGAQVTGFTVNGEPTEFEVLPHAGRSVVKVRIEIAPKESVSLSYTLGGEFSPDVRAVVTPLSSPNLYTKWVDTSGLKCGSA